MSGTDVPVLRYADGPSTEASIVIAAPPELVWELVSDLQLPARFSNEFRGAELLGEETVPAVGVQFTGHNHHPAIGSWKTTSTITSFESPMVFAYDVEGEDGRPSASWRFSLEPTADGTRLTQAMRMGPATERNQSGDRRHAGQRVEDPPPPTLGAPHEHGGDAGGDQGAGRGLTPLRHCGSIAAGLTWSPG